jgi:hypothetical protein
MRTITKTQLKKMIQEAVQEQVVERPRPRSVSERDYDDAKKTLDDIWLYVLTSKQRSNQEAIVMFDRLNEYLDRASNCRARS